MTDDAKQRIRLAAAQMRNGGVTTDGMNIDVADPDNIPAPRYADLKPKGPSTDWWPR